MALGFGANEIRGALANKRDNRRARPADDRAAPGSPGRRTGVAIIEWSDELSVNILAIDEQHKRLVAMINDLHQAMVARQTRDALRAIIDRMCDYAVVHFATEEKYMTRLDYPAYAEHKTEHDEFTAKARDLQARLAAGGLVLSLEVINFLRQWLTDHIRGSDKQYAPFFHAHGLR